jgi:long-chain fatty acid transport protein
VLRSIAPGAWRVRPVTAHDGRGRGAIGDFTVQKLLGSIHLPARDAGRGVPAARAAARELDAAGGGDRGLLTRKRYSMNLDHRSRRVAAVAAVLVAVGAAPELGAQGFGLNEIGSCSVARAGAGVADPCRDASMLYWNPAAAAMSRDSSRWSFLIGAAPITLNGSFTADTTLRRDKADVPVEVPPHLFVNWTGRLDRFNVGRIGLGLGVYVPYGLTSAWSADFPGRFAARRASLQTVYIQPTLSLEVVPNRLSFGIGPVIGHSKIELVQSVDLATAPAPAPAPEGTTLGQLGVPAGTEFAVFNGNGEAWAGGFHAGVQIRVTPSLSLGGRLLSALYFEYEGEGRFDQVLTNITLAANSPFVGGSGPSVRLDDVVAPQFGPSGPLVRQDIRSAIKHPAQVQVGAAFTGLERTTLNADYMYGRWRDFDVLPVTFLGAAASRSREIIEDYDDSHAFRFAAEHEFLGSTAAPFLNGISGRLGFSYIKTPAPDLTVTPLLPDMDRYNFGIGAGIPLSARTALDLSYLRVETPGRRGRIVERSADETDLAALNSGWYELTANIFSVSLKASF